MRFEEHDLTCYPAILQEPMRRYYSEFESSVSLANEVFQKRAGMSFVQLLIDVGYLGDSRRQLIHTSHITL